MEGDGGGRWVSDECRWMPMRERWVSIVSAVVIVIIIIAIAIAIAIAIVITTIAITIAIALGGAAMGPVALRCPAAIGTPL